MSGPQPPWWDATGSGEAYTLKVRRSAKPPLPWTWEIVGDPSKVKGHSSVRGFPSAEEAWHSGRAALSDLESPKLRR